MNFSKCIDIVNRFLHYYCCWHRTTANQNICACTHQAHAFFSHTVCLLCSYFCWKVSIPKLMMGKKRATQTNKIPKILQNSISSSLQNSNSNDTTSTRIANSNTLPPTITTTKNSESVLGYWLEIFCHTSYSFNMLTDRKNANENATMHCMMINYMQFAFNTQIMFSASSNVCRISCANVVYFILKWSNNPKCVDYLCMWNKIRGMGVCFVCSVYSLHCTSAHCMLFCSLYIVIIVQFISN